VNSAGGQGDLVFPEVTCQSVFQATGGVPRLINQVCDHAMLLSYVAGKKTIEPANIEEAWADLQQLPTPWSGESKSDQTSGGVIEFGSLDDVADSEGPSSGSKPMATLLRVAQAEDEPEDDDATPECQIHRIERLLAKADENDFQPAGSIGPEVVLCFEDAGHPFQEEFEHEEVVSDRYASRTAFPKTSEKKLEETKTSAIPKVRIPLSKPTEQEAEVELEPTPASDESWNESFAGGWYETCDTACSTAENVAAPVRKKEYRHLFAQLRRG
jgi:hypothetical protein